MAVTRDYSRPFGLEGPVGNNALSYDRRSALGAAPTLHVPALMTGGAGDLKAGRSIAFEEFDEHGVLHSCTGLDALVRTTWHGVPTLIFDNHNHAFYFWMEALMTGGLTPGAALIHIDQHRDTRIPERDYSGSTLEEAFDYTNFHLNVGNYIVPAERCGLVGDIQFVTGEEALQDFSMVDRQNKILNIDLDFFAPEMGYIDFELASRFIQAHRRTASLVTMATSPFFIDQDEAIDRARFLLNMGA